MLTAPPKAPSPSSTQAPGAHLLKDVAVAALVFVVACWVLFAQLGTFPLFNPDEALYAEPAREMLETGEYITTLLNYDVRFTKPPLVIWAMAACYPIFGVNEFAARFFGAACGTILIAVTHSFLTRCVGARAGVFASLSLLTAPLYVGTAREAITDMPLSLFLAGCLFAFYRGMQEKTPFWRWLGYVLVGLAVMTKGPVGLVLPVAVLGVFHVLRGDWRQALAFYKPAWGLLIVGLIALPWFVAEITITKGAYFQEFIMRENFQRFTSVVDSHKGAWWYHLAAMAGGFFPWFVFVPQALARALSGTKPEGVAGTNPISRFLSRYRQASGQGDLLLFFACMVTVTLFFFSASVSKLLPYTMPAFPALAGLVALELEHIFTRRALARLLAPFAVLAIIYGAAGMIAPAALQKLRNAPSGLATLVTAYLSFQCLTTIATLVLAMLARPLAAVSMFAVLTLSASAFWGQQALDMVSKEWEAPLPGMAKYAALSGFPVVVFDMRKPSVPFYTLRKVIQPGSEQALKQTLSETKNAYVLTKAKRRAFFESLEGCRIVTEEGAFLLVQWRNPVLNLLGDFGGRRTFDSIVGNLPDGRGCRPIRFNREN